MRLSKDEKENLRALADTYAREHGVTEYEIKDVVRWGMATSRLEMSDFAMEEFFGERMRVALSSDCIQTPSGSTVRVRYSIKVRSNGEADKPVDRHLWSHIDDARDEFVIEAIRIRVLAAKADIRQARADLAYFNERRISNGKRPIQLNIDDMLRDDDEPYQSAG